MPGGQGATDWVYPDRVKTFRSSLWLPVAVSLATLGTVVAGGAELDEQYTASIRPLLERKCFDCHDAETAKADLNLAAFGDLESVKAAPEIWQRVRERVQAYEMPPKKSGELSYGEYQDLMAWLRRLPPPDKPDCDQIASDRTANFYRGYVMSRRLNRAEYLNTVRDLLGVEVPLAELLPADGGGGEGFDTSGDALFLSPVHIERYLRASELAITTALPDRGRDLDPARRQARRRLLVARPGPELPPRDAARRVVETFARRAFRRPVTAEEVDRLLTLFDRGWDRGDGYVPSLRLALQGALVSPHFLFLAEPEPEAGGVQRLGAVPLASRLSYFLWSSMPDDRLLRLAESGELLRPEIYQAELRRLLADPRADSLGERFALQWLDLERLGTEVRPDPARFPEFDAALAASMRAEVVAYVNHVFRQDRPLVELIDSEYTLVDARMAALYGLEVPAGTGVHPVTLTHRSRGGLLGMAAIHTANSYPLRTSPVLRGRWILETLLGDKVPPPPPGVPALEESAAAATHESLRRQLEVHRANAECAACHDRMDPLGFGLENFDVLGRWRDTDRGQPIDAQGVLPSGQSFDGPEGLKRVLLAQKEKVLRHLARKLTGFALGRDLNKFDDCVIDQAMTALHAQNYRAFALIEAIATSFPFQHRFYPLPNS